MIPNSLGGELEKSKMNYADCRPSLDVLGRVVENVDLRDGPSLAVRALPRATARIAVFLDPDITALDLGGVLGASEPHIL